MKAVLSLLYMWKKLCGVYTESELYRLIGHRFGEIIRVVSAKGMHGY
jgi:hypothetical protein